MSHSKYNHFEPQPRLIRLKYAPSYLGMDRNRFNDEVRPSLTEIPIGLQGIAFDRLEIDAWVDQYISSNGRPTSQPRGKRLWDANEAQGSEIGMASGTLRNRCSDKRFVKALEQATSKRRN